ncbi:hypothetical protein Tco_1320979 [Tanacetum coccineum]
MDDSTREIIDEDQSNDQEVQTEETPTHDVHDVIESDEQDHSDAPTYVDSESDNECQHPTPNEHMYWIPDIPVEEKPTKGDVFDNFDEAYIRKFKCVFPDTFSSRQHVGSIYALF